MLILAIIFTSAIFRAVLAANSEMAINGGKVTIRGGYLDFGVRERDVIVISTTTGQCLGTLCGVTHAN